MSDLSNGHAIPDDARLEVFNLWEAGQISNSDLTGSKELRNIFRDLAQKSLFFCCKAVLGYTKLTKASHLYICQRTQDLTQKRQLVLMPRGTYKSTIRTKGFPIWLLLNDPNQTILIANQTSDNAELFLDEIEQHFDGRNDMMNWLFPEYIKPNDRWKPWSSKQMTLPCRERISGTASITAAGCGTRLESRHYDVVLPDDLVGLEAAKSEPEMLAAKIWHDAAVALLNSPKEGIVRDSGTRYGHNDLYVPMINDPRYEVIQISAWDEASGEVNFPDILPADTLDAIRGENYQLYRLWYMNDADNPEILEFKQAWLQKYMLVKGQDGIPVCILPDKRKLPITDLDIIMVLDPAASGDIASTTKDAIRKTKMQKSNNALEVWGMSNEGDMILLDMWAGRTAGENPEYELARHMLSMCRQWKGFFRTLYLEAFGMQGAIRTVFNMLCRDVGEAYPIEFIPKGIQTGKLVRIRAGLGGIARNGRLFIRACHALFEAEFTKFPESPTLDTLDAGAWAAMFLRRPASTLDVTTDNKRRDEYETERLDSISICGY